MSRFQQELWSIFTFYNLQSGNSDPGLMRRNRFMKLCHDCQLVSRRVSAPDLGLSFALQAKRDPEGDAAMSATKRKALKGRALTFLDFLEALRSVAIKVYPQLKNDPNSAFRKLLLENVLPLASRRQPMDISHALTIPVFRLLGNVDTDAGEGLVKHGILTRGLRSIFRWYAKKYANRKAQELGEEMSWLKKTGRQAVASSRRMAREARITEHQVGFREVMDFAMDYGMFSSDSGIALLTTVQMADIYLASTPPVAEGPVEDVPHLMEPHFILQLLRMANQAFPEDKYYSQGGAGPASMEDKMKAFLLHMWKSVNHPRKAERFKTGQGTVTRSLQGGRGGDLNLHGSATFNATFYDLWSKDGFPDYLVLKEQQDNSITRSRKVGLPTPPQNGTLLGNTRGSMLRRGDNEPPSYDTLQPDPLNLRGSPNPPRLETAEEPACRFKTSELKQLFERDGTLVDFLAGEIEDTLRAFH